MVKTEFTKKEQIEILKILKGVLLYTTKKSDITNFERTILEEILDSCSKIIEIIEEKNNE